MSVPDWLVSSPIAHRGMQSESVPENSLESFRLAIDRGVPIEFDLQFTADNKLIVFHDRNLLRMTGKSLAVTTHRLETIRANRLLLNNELIPTFEELLKLVRGQIPLMVEIKPARLRHHERALAVKAALDNYAGELVIQSFDPRIVRWFKANSSHTIGLVVGRYRDPSISRSLRKKLENPWISQRVSLPKALSPDFIAHDLKSLSAGVSDKIRLKNKLPLVAWTVKTPEQIAQANALADNYIFEGLISKMNKLLIG